MQIINARKVNCKDCRRCLRVCPVGAIGLNGGRSRVLPDKCILCGKCVVECPQHAKSIVSQIPLIQRAMEKKRRVVLSIGTSFLGLFPEYTPARLVAVLQAMGFCEVEETAAGADAVSAQYRNLMSRAERTVISSNCPVIVGIVRKYYPSLVRYLAPVVSPMLAHGRMIKKRCGEDTFVVFAGPCIAKFGELEDGCGVDAVATFVQLRRWIKRYRSVHRGETYAKNDRQQPTLRNARFFPLAGGILKSFMDFDALSNDVIAVDGIEDCKEVFQSLAAGEIAPKFIEAFSCRGGCIGGPASGSRHSLPVRRLKAIEEANAAARRPLSPPPAGIDFGRVYTPAPVEAAQPSETQIAQVLRQTGKFTRADEKNCGACGYSSCREKAAAVCRGLAEITMCMPYMRSKAESFANIIVQNSLNGIVAVDGKMIIQEFNPALDKMFGRRRPMKKGDDLRDYIDCADFIAAITSGVEIVNKRVEYESYGLVTEQMIAPAPESALVIGVISNVTATELRAHEWEIMKEETVAKATEIIHKQMQVAQEIAGLLGETTADTKAALLELMTVLKCKEEA